MHIYSSLFPDTELLPLLDEEFDKVDITPNPNCMAVGPALLCDELAWDDQIDNGEEMSL